MAEGKRNGSYIMYTLDIKYIIRLNLYKDVVLTYVVHAYGFILHKFDSVTFAGKIRNKILVISCFLIMLLLLIILALIS